MAELVPFPFDALVRRMFGELAARDSVYDLPRRRFWRGPGERDLSVGFHAQRVATALGPAAGPQSQMAQNLVLSWLGGGRVHELKTVQVNDRLEIPRPCIDMQTVGYNVEWSQELRLAESLEEYVKGAMLIRMLEESGELELEPGAGGVLFDMSVGYDLAGLQSEGVRAFLLGMRDCGGLVDRLRAQIPAEFARYRDLDYARGLSNTLTLSTFHGCPPDEIERMCAHLLEQHGLHTIVKLNPMLLGAEEVRGLLNDTLGYEELRVPDSAFERDTRWEQALGFVERLRERAAGLGQGFGIKLTNTLIVENHREFFPEGEREMYLSGAPLHVLAMRLVQRFRGEFGGDLPISFSAGIDRNNFADALALGLVPVTVCSDLLRPGGYARARGYLEACGERMDAVGAQDVEAWCMRAYGQGRAALDELGLDAGSSAHVACVQAWESGGDLRAAAGEELYERWRARTLERNADHYLAQLVRDPRYTRASTDRPPKKIGSALELFDCITCDKCVPVCPNDANFTFDLPPRELTRTYVRREADAWLVRHAGQVVIEQRHQLANLADFCNECGNCDIFCPEDGGPYLVKPRFFRRHEDWRRYTHLDGFQLERQAVGSTLHARIDGRELSLEQLGARRRFSGPDFELEFDPADPLASLTGTATKEVELSWWQVLEWLRESVYESSTPSWLTC